MGKAYGSPVPNIEDVLEVLGLVPPSSLGQLLQKDKYGSRP